MKLIQKKAYEEFKEKEPTNKFYKFVIIANIDFCEENFLKANKKEHLKIFLNKTNSTEEDLKEEIEINNLQLLIEELISKSFVLLKINFEYIYFSSSKFF